jgi:hypothetical protein
LVRSILNENIATGTREERRSQRFARNGYLMRVHRQFPVPELWNIPTGPVSLFPHPTQVLSSTIPARDHNVQNYIITSPESPAATCPITTNFRKMIAAG